MQQANKMKAEMHFPYFVLNYDGCDGIKTMIF